MECYKCHNREAANRKGLCNQCHKIRYVKDRNRKIMEIAKSKPCVDCKEKYPYYIMEFDHVPGRGTKSFAISSGLAISLIKLETEMKKCDIVCANCHRRRTYMRHIMQRTHTPNWLNSRGVNISPIKPKR